MDEQALAADGLPIVEGETVYDAVSGKAYTVDRVRRREEVEVYYVIDATDNKKRYACLTNVDRTMTHTPPDTQERIDEDAMKTAVTYWACDKNTCKDCKVQLICESPRKHFWNPTCEQAKLKDLLRRQRELDARLMGGE